MEIVTNEHGFKEALVNSKEFDRFICLLWGKVDCRVYYEPIVVSYLERREQIDHSAMQSLFNSGADFVRLKWVSSSRHEVMASMKINGRRHDVRGATVRGTYKIHRTGIEWLESNGHIRIETTVKETVSF